jgi:hypothetical protein
MLISKNDDVQDTESINKLIEQYYQDKKKACCTCEFIGEPYDFDLPFPVCVRGTCRKYGPKPLLLSDNEPIDFVQRTIFPTVDAFFDWCGEYKRQEDENAKFNYN